MDKSLLYSKLSSLPEKLKKEVEAFIDNLISKKVASGKKQPVFGSAKGMFVMREDFDEPLEDFKDYME